jgi:hypothetical protein
MSGDGFVWRSVLARRRIATALVAAATLAGIVALVAPRAGAGTATSHLAPDFVHVRSHRTIRAAVRANSPDAIKQFPGEVPCLGGICSSPGEPVIAVGSKDILQTSNTAATVYSKTGEKLAEFDFYKSFWGPEVED